MTDKEMALGSAVERMHMSSDDSWPDNWEIAVCELAEELNIDENIAELILSIEMEIPADFLVNWLEESTVLRETILC